MSRGTTWLAVALALAVFATPGAEAAPKYRVGMKIDVRQPNGQWFRAKIMRTKPGGEFQVRLDDLPAERATLVGAFAYILSRVAHADMSISAEETRAMTGGSGSGSVLP